MKNLRQNPDDNKALFYGESMNEADKDLLRILDMLEHHPGTYVRSMARQARINFEVFKKLAEEVNMHTVKAYDRSFSDVADICRDNQGLNHD